MFETSESEQVLSDYQHSLEPLLRSYYAMQVITKPVKTLYEAYNLAATVDDNPDRRNSSLQLASQKSGAGQQGCHHCGISGHTYTQCNALKRLLGAPPKP